MAEGKIRVKFEEKGSAKLIAAIKSLNRETGKLAGSSKKYAKQTKKTTKAQNNQRNAITGLIGKFSVFRSKMLLGAFALKQFIDPFVAMGKRSVMVAANFEALETRLASMTGSTDKAAEMMKDFRDVAASTPFAIQDVVEAGVQLRAFGVDAQKMIKPVTDLAAFMGTTAVDAASALGRALAGGAGAADILRERGILQLIKDTQGIADLSKTTLPQFRKALESALVDPTAGIVGATTKLSKTTVGAFSNMQDSLDTLLAKYAEVSGLKDFVTGVAKAITGLASSAERSLNAPTELATRFQVVRFTLEDFSQAIIDTKGDTNELTLIWQELMKEQDKLIGQYSGLKGGLNDVRGMSEKVRTEYDILNEKINTVAQSITALGGTFKLVYSASGGIMDTMELFNQGSETLLNEYWIKRHMANIEGLNLERSRLIEAANDTIEDEAENQLVRLEINRDYNNKIKALNEARAAQTAKDAARERKYYASSLEGLKHLVKGKIQAYIADAIAGFVAREVSTKGWVGMATATAGVIAVNELFKLIPQFQQGGLIEGQRHSQGGTPIVAERGEFVMSRNAVSAIGVENLNRMNDGQGGGGTTININGGMISPDFVENELADAIKTAIRRGSDFGIS